MSNFADRLLSKVKSLGNPVCVGLDPRLKNLPKELQPSENSPQEIAVAFEKFCKAIIDVVAEHVPIVKPQAAFFEQYGAAGFAALENTVAAARAKGLLVLMDAKRGDIGSTAAAYASGFLDQSSPIYCDSLTVNPYLGDDSIDPFIETAQQNEAGIFVLAKTSNPGGKLFQDVVTDSGKPMYRVVSEFIEQRARESKGECDYGQVGAVVGATYPEQLAELREVMPHTIFLIPGFGAQGGTAEDIKHGFDTNGLGAIVNSSRGIIFAYEKDEFAASDWQDSVNLSLQKMIAQLSQTTRA